MAYKVPRSKASNKQNRFEFTMPDSDRTYSVPLLSYLKPALVTQLEGSTKSDAVRELIEAYNPGLFDEFEDTNQLVEFYEAWAEASGISLGESSGSSS